MFLILFAFSAVNAQTDDLTKLKYFKIEVKTADDILFTKLQKDMAIDPIVDEYVLVVNITSDVADNQYIVFGQEDNVEAIKMSWNDITKEVRDGLLAWSKPNKTKIEPKKKK
jgi:hypothetical protein